MKNIDSASYIPIPKGLSIDELTAIENIRKELCNKWLVNYKASMEQSIISAEIRANQEDFMYGEALAVFYKNRKADIIFASSKSNKE